MNLFITIVLLATLGSNAQVIDDTANQTSTNNPDSYVTLIAAVQYIPTVKAAEMQCGVAPRFQNIDTSTKRQTTRRHKRVVNGRNAGYGEHPWTASIMRQKQYLDHSIGFVEFCGASLISSTYLITAAHCVDDVEHFPEFLFVRVGNHNNELNEGTEQIRKVGALTIHPRYDYEEEFFDIAIIKLEEPVQFTDYVQPVCLPSSNDSDLIPGTMTTALGFVCWNEMSGVLKKVDLPIASNNKCLFNPFIPDDNSIICAGNGTGRDICMGDFGGPLVWLNPVDNKWYLRGVTNYSGLPSVPAGFANVKWYIEWIKSVIQ